MTIRLPHALPPRLPNPSDPESTGRIRLRDLMLPAAIVALVGWQGIRSDPSFLSPNPLSSLWLFILIDLWPHDHWADALEPILIGFAHGLLYLAWTWPALRLCPTRIPIAFLIALSGLAALNLLWVLIGMVWGSFLTALVPIALLVQGFAQRRENEPSMLAMYYAVAFAWFAFGAFTWPPGVWI